MKKHNVTWYKKKLDKVFSLWIRARDKRCVTCGSRDNLQAGHFVSRSHYSLRYSEVNVNCQCLRCNVFLRGNMTVYAEFMERKYGQGIIQQLNRERRKTKQWTIPELQELISRYEIL